tara:strand:- start:272 stop:943 length:672 start_codon:yes stop_codon:yes gene_type:complete
MQIIGLIPARSGSKGIKDKNIVNFRGQPLISHSITHSKESNLITRTIVSTDSDKYAEVALSYGAEVPFIRPAKISQDLSRDSEVYIHAINALNLQKDDIIVHLRPTTPLRENNLIDNVLEKMIEKDSPAIRTLSLSEFSPYKMVFCENNFIKPVLEIDGKINGTDLPRQLLPKTYELNGNVDAFRISTYNDLKVFFPKNTLGYIQNSPTADIDLPSDLEILNQ